MKWASILLGGAALMAAPGAWAQPQPLPMLPLTQGPTVTALVRGVNSKESLRPLEIRKLALTASVRGAVATAELTLEIHATTSEPVEGRVGIALPQGAVVTGYALDVGGVMIDGALVDRARAQAAFEQNERRQVDPGLATVDIAGGFNTRVFPIDQAKGRRLKLRFTAPVGDGWTLPLAGTIAAGGWQVSIYGAEGGTVRLGTRGLRPSGGALVLSGTGALPGDLRIAAATQPETVASVHGNGETVWQLSGTLPPAAARPGGGSLRVYWDRSRSRRDQDHGAELARVREAIAALRPARIELVSFASNAPERTVVTSADALEAKVRGLGYRGATSYRLFAREAAADECLLVSDGQVTLDQEVASPPPCRLTVIVPSQGANRARLAALAQAGGGKLVSVGAAAVDWTAPTVERVTDAAGKPLPFTMLPAPRGQWTLLAQAPASGSVRVTAGGVTVERSASAAAVRFDGAAALLAATRLPLLEGTASRADYVALSRRYAIASPSLSFVVLERPEDYVTAGIVPPANYPQAAKVAELQDAADANRKAEADGRLEAVVKQWTEQLAYYDTRFDLAWRPANEASDKPRAVNAPAPVIVTSANAPGTPPAPPPPPPPPPPPAPERDGDDSNDIIVTSQRRASPGDDVRISVDAWNPDRAYLKAFDAAPADFDRLYAQWERDAGGVPAFYLDTADWLVRHERAAEAPDVLLSALDLPTANEVTLGMVAARLERYGAFDAAVALRERQALLDTDHPQPKRLLALVLARRAALGGAGAKADLTRAVTLLRDVALSPLDNRWDGIDLISLVELNALLPKLRALGGEVAIDPRLVRNLASDLRVVIDWSNDATDIDLWVDEPSGQRVIYSNPRSNIGGHLSNDMTSGYGPEEYFLRRAAPGAYVARAHVFSPDRLDPNGAARVTAHLYRDWGRPTQREQVIDFDVSRGKDGELMIGTLKVDRPGEK